MDHAKEFHKTLSDFMYNIASIVADCHQEGLTNITEEGVNLQAAIINALESKFLVKTFAKHHSLWEKIYRVEPDFIKEELSKIYSEDVDTTVFAVPLDCYNKLLKEHGKNASQEEWPVIEKDIEDMWKFLKNMVIHCCRYANAHPIKNFPLQTYVDRFEIKL